jgi:hypothetical protein
VAGWVLEPNSLLADNRSDEPVARNSEPLLHRLKPEVVSRRFFDFLNSAASPIEILRQHHSTLCVRATELSEAFESPEYVTEIGFDPFGRDEMFSLALPPLSWNVPSNVVPDMKTTVPFGVTVGEFIVAVNVTGLPKIDGFLEDVIVADVMAWFTI